MNIEEFNELAKLLRRCKDGTLLDIKAVLDHELYMRKDIGAWIRNKIEGEVDNVKHRQ